MVVPCSLQRENSWLEVIGLLRGLLLRHTKSDLQLHPSIHSAISLDPMYHSEDDALDHRYEYWRGEGGLHSAVVGYMQGCHGEPYYGICHLVSSHHHHHHYPPPPPHHRRHHPNHHITIIIISSIISIVIICIWTGSDMSVPSIGRKLIALLSTCG